MISSDCYKDIVCLVTFNKREVSPALIDRQYNEQGELVSETVIEPAKYEVFIATPFTRYSEEVWRDGQKISNYSDRLDLDGQEAIMFTSCIHIHLHPGFLPSEMETAFNWENTLATNWDDAKDEFKVIEHYGVTKAQALSTTDTDGNTIPYTGADKDELHKPEGWF